ncbi:DUF4870 domain-containing protein [Chroogloeocystis siderophila]|jgi:uncharacterized Tic20 family protein|uniref:DUF4870 domain-containing protein n=1 Tax=Chroogloeocystis siderophila 5.2 s.c.1 TaxID=247279 RepID=A0A1U7HVC0_9CHRO|nr:DUF4870 domain-containing protein [Chroogloeocystis siderophila]OKH27475.1 hypothetical protein NIES1031_09355 [Chroogloeocystis siderophila 5.2 s.c.1]
MNDTDKRKLLSGLSHAALMLNAVVIPVLVPIVILLATHDSIVRGNAKEAINFTINIIICGVISSILILVEGIGVFLLFFLAIISFIMPLIATIYAVKNVNKPYRYPLIWHFL